MMDSKCVISPANLQAQDTADSVLTTRPAETDGLPTAAQHPTRTGRYSSCLLLLLLLVVLVIMYKLVRMMVEPAAAKAFCCRKSRQGVLSPDLK